MGWWFHSQFILITQRVLGQDPDTHDVGVSSVCGCLNWFEKAQQHDITFT